MHGREKIKLTKVGDSKQRPSWCLFERKDTYCWLYKHQDGYLAMIYFEFLEREGSIFISTPENREIVYHVENVKSLEQLKIITTKKLVEHAEAH